MVPYISKIPVNRDSTASHLEVDVPSHSWVLELPAEIGFHFDVIPNGIVIRSGYMEVFKGLLEYVGLKTVGVETNLGEAETFNNPFLDPQFLNTEQSLIGPGSKIFILTGQPGSGVYHIRATLHHNHAVSGKSLWLVLALVLRLHARLPTMYQSTPEKILFFSEDGVELFSTSSLGRFAPSKRTEMERLHLWALINSDETLKNVDPRFVALIIPIVQTPSPREDRLQWLNKVSVPRKLFLLQPWSLAELIVG